MLDASMAGDNVVFRGVSTDTRKLLPGSLYFALQGPNFDGHAFVEEARDQGAAAAAVSRPCDSSLPQMEVADTRLALGQLGAFWRQQFSLPVVAITGSNGKTTVRAMIESILSTCGRVLSTQGNLNNDIGLPLTLARLGPEDQYAVLEMGANHHGEIDYLAGLAQPSIAVVTNAGPAHLEGFGDMEGVARAKGELFARLDAGATAVINADDVFAPLWRSLASHCRIVEFGLDADAAVWRLLEVADLPHLRALAGVPIQDGGVATTQSIRDTMHFFGTLTTNSAALITPGIPRQATKPNTTRQPMIRFVIIPFLSCKICDRCLTSPHRAAPKPLPSHPRTASGTRRSASTSAG